MKTRHLILVAVAAVGSLLSACSLDPYIITSEEEYTRSFIKTFGLIDPEQDWNLAQAGTVTVNTGEGARSVKVYSKVGEKFYLVADLTNIKGTVNIPLDVPEGSNDLLVKIDGKRYPTTLGSEVTAVKSPSRAEGDHIGQYPITVTNIAIDATENNNVFNAAQLTPLTSATVWKPYYTANGNEWRTNDNSVNNGIGILPEQVDNRSNEYVTEDFLLKYDGPFSIFPMYWWSHQTHTVGVYLVDKDGNALDDNGDIADSAAKIAKYPLNVITSKVTGGVQVYLKNFVISPKDSDNNLKAPGASWDDNVISDLNTTGSATVFLEGHNDYCPQYDKVISGIDISKIKWFSSNSEVANVSGDGTQTCSIAAVGSGKFFVYALIVDNNNTLHVARSPLMNITSSRTSAKNRYNAVAKAGSRADEDEEEYDLIDGYYYPKNRDKTGTYVGGNRKDGFSIQLQNGNKTFNIPDFVKSEEAFRSMIESLWTAMNSDSDVNHSGSPANSFNSYSSTINAFLKDEDNVKDLGWQLDYSNSVFTSWAVNDYQMYMIFRKPANSGSDPGTGGSDPGSDPSTPTTDPIAAFDHVEFLATYSDDDAIPYLLEEEDGAWVDLKYTIGGYDRENIWGYAGCNDQEAFQTTYTILLRTNGAVIDIEGYEGYLGMYSVFGSNVVYSQKKWNPGGVSYAATYKHPVSERLFFSFEDWIGNNVLDMNDIIFRLGNVSLTNITTTDKATEHWESSVTNEDVLNWLVAAEDLGATDDFDFNDVIFQLTSVTTNYDHTQETIEYDENKNVVSVKGDGTTTSVEKSVSVQAMAAGGTLETYLHYSNGEDEYLLGPKDYIMKWTGSGWIAEGSSSDNLAAYEWHKWFGNYNHTTMLNTSKANVTKPFSCDISEIVNSSSFESSLEKFSIANYSSQYAQSTGSNAKVRGFYITVGTADPSSMMTDIGGNTHVDKTNEVRVINAKGQGEAPQMFLIPDIGTETGKGWAWPTERTHIVDSYGDFGSWVTDADANRDWHTKGGNYTIRAVEGKKTYHTHTETTNKPNKSNSGSGSGD